MEIRIRSTGEVMTEITFRVLHDKLRPRLPHVITPEILDGLDADPVFEGPQATGGDRYQYSQRAGVEQDSEGRWFSKYILGPVFADRTNEDGTVSTAAEQEAEYKARKDVEQAASVRAERNSRISKLDWTQGKDIPDSISTPAATIRQALRDVPQQAGFPWEVVWPE